jgi:hypothetical protein
LCGIGEKRFVENMTVEADWEAVGKKALKRKKNL